jgi:hypothetical protein
MININCLLGYCLLGYGLMGYCLLGYGLLGYCLLGLSYRQAYLMAADREMTLLPRDVPHLSGPQGMLKCEYTRTACKTT